MSEPATTAETAEATPEREGADGQQPETDWKARSREWERRAKENKAAADELRALKEAQKSDEQKAADRLAEAEQKAADAEFRAAVAEIAAAHQVPTELAMGPAGRTAEAVAEYVQSVLSWADGRRRQGNVAPLEGGSAVPTDEHADLRATLRGMGLGRQH